MTHDETYREGLFAAAGGQSAFDCPYSNQYEHDKRVRWFAGFTNGMRQLRLDRLSGRDPNAYARSEFGLETGHRAGRSTGARK